MTDVVVFLSGRLSRCFCSQRLVEVGSISDASTLGNEAERLQPLGTGERVIHFLPFAENHVLCQ